MPLYDYGCPSCGFEKEVQHPMSEVGKANVFCDHCGKQMDKMLSAPTLIGFDDIGRSISKKDKAESGTNETSKSSEKVVSSNDSAKPAVAKSPSSKDAA